MAIDRAGLAYTSCYCEENVWHLAGDPRFEGRPSFVVFISNPSKSCAIWAQRAATEPGAPVVWDYHVVLLVSEHDTVRVYDLDSRLPFGCTLEEYLGGSFPSAQQTSPTYAPWFRVVPAEAYRARFASDRSHMRGPRGLYQSPPPAWPAIRNEIESMNLERFVNMKKPFLGEVVDLDGLRARFSK